MNLMGLIPTEEQLEKAKSIEQKLLRRRRTGTLGAGFAIFWAIIQILIASYKDSYLQNIKAFVGYLIKGQWIELFKGDNLLILAVILVFAAGLGIYFVLKWTSFLVKEAEDPFRYTFWIKRFESVDGTPGERLTVEAEDRLRLLHHDLMGRLNERIRRLSLLEVAPASESAEIKRPTSHIHIEGYYAVREEKDGEWIIHVMPRVRIGPEDSPSKLAYPVKCSIVNNSEESKIKLEVSVYKQIVERVYSSIATEIYRQIKLDIKEKISLFPTGYLRAIALYNEAKDFEKSNTIDAYDRAIELYREVKHYFDVKNIRWFTKILIRFPIFWRTRVKFIQMWARAEIGYSKCLIYRRQVSAISGRYMNPIFEIPGKIEEVINILKVLYGNINIGLFGKNNRLNYLLSFLTFPEDSWFRSLFRQPQKILFESQRRVLFNAYTVAALAYYFLGAVKFAEERIEDAKAVAPDLSERDALYLLAAGLVEPDLDKEILLFRKATEIAPNFEIAQYFLAYYSEMRFRTKERIEKARADSIIEEYNEVLKLNPGSLASLSAQGYIKWLLGTSEEIEEAKKKFKEGCELKAIVRETFIGELKYGLARIAAEEGCFNESYDFYNQAIAADPGVGIFSITSSFRALTSYYNYIIPEMLERYRSFKINVENKINSLKKSKEGTFIDGKRKDDNKFSQKTIDVVYSFVLNDYGNACLNYFHRFGDSGQLDNAIKAFEEATRKYSDNAVVYYNLHNAYSWRRAISGKISADLETKILESCEKAEKLAPALPIALISSAQTQARQINDQIRDKKNELETEEKRKKQTEIERKLEKEKKEENLQEILMMNQLQEGETTMKGQLPQSGKLDLEGTQDLVWDRSKRVEELKKEIEGLQKDLRDKVFKKIENIMYQTKLSSLFEGLKIDYDGKGVAELYKKRKKIKRDILDENDIDALRIWAEILSYNIGNEKALEASIKLGELIKDHYPINFDIDTVLLIVYILLKRTEDAKNTRENLNSLVVNWLAQDPIHYTSLNFGIYFGDVLDVDESIRLLYEAIKEEPENGVYYCMLGDVYCRQSNYTKAIESYKIAIELNKTKDYSHKLAEAFFYQGNSMRDKGENIKAEEAYLEALKIEPDNAEYNNNLGNVYYASVGYERSIEFYEKAIGLDPSMAVYHANLGGSYKALGNWKKAEEAYLEALRIEPDSAGYNNSLGNVYYASGDYIKAAELYKKAAELEPNVALYHSNLIKAYIESGNEKEADISYRKAINIDVNNPVYQNALGLALLLSEDYDRALGPCRNAAKLDPTVAIYHASLGGSYRALRNWEKAEEAFLKALKIEPGNAGYNNSLGNIYYESGNYERSIEFYQKAIELDSSVAVYHANLGGSYKALGNLKKAEEAFLNALKIEPDNAVYNNNLGNAYYGSGNYAKSIEFYEKAIELDSSVAVYHSNLGVSYKELGNLKKAEEAFLNALKIEPDNVVYNNDLGNVYYGSGDFEKSIELYKKAIKLDDKVAVYHSNLGSSYRALEKWKEAEKAYKKAIEIEPDNARHNNDLGNVYYESNRHNKSVEFYKRAIKLNPSVAVYHSNLGVSYRALEKRKEAEKAFLEALKIEPDNAVYNNDLGNVYYASGDYIKAAELYKKATELEPNIALYHSNLIKAYIESRNEKEAEISYKKAINIDANDPIYQNALGNVLFGNGIYGKAAERYIKAIEKDPGVQVYISNLILACDKIKDRHKALSLLKSALRLVPGNKEITQAIERLEKK